ncbi:MAG: hypothetical protein JKY54_14450, partial [Flavobacteriales bacterium]|nr:hypothetical protein [Flavobacteriales bacterium]
ISATDSVIYLYKYRYEEVVISAYDFKSQHVVTIDFFPGHSEKMILTEKPVIYVYSPDEVAVKVKVDQIGEMTFTYPKLEESWKFTADTSGEITMNDGNKYPYLFWEANRSELGATVNNHIIPGEIVAKKDIVHFLETSLLALGLTAKEKTDFITYWGPRMQTFNNTFIQFTIDDEVGPLIGALQVDPKPDSFRRVFVRFMDANEINLFAIYTLQKQSFTSFKREGLTVVEWGGSEIHKIMLYEN